MEDLLSFQEENELHIQDFNKNFAIRELFNYAKEVRQWLNTNSWLLFLVLQRPSNRA